MSNIVTESPRIETFDPEVPSDFANLQDIYVAHFDLIDCIESHRDLLHRLLLRGKFTTYSFTNALKNYLRLETHTNVKIDPGDYFIVYAPDVQVMQRYVYLGDGLSPFPDQFLVDPFAEILRTYRSLFFTHALLDDEEPPESPDEPLESFHQFFEEEIQYYKD